MIMIRELLAADLAGAAALIGDLGLFPPELLAEMSAAYLDGNAQTEIWTVAECDGQLSGLSYCAPEKLTDGTWNLYLIAVRAAAQGRGVGTALLAWLERHLVRRRARLLLVETSSLTAFGPARSFYHRGGFEEAAHIRDFYQAGDHKLIFIKQLGPRL